MMRALVLFLTMSLTAAGAHAQAAREEITVFAAGSLRAAMTEVAKAFEAAEPKAPVKLVFGASGLLKDRIAGGEHADVFASANMAHPQALAAAGKASPVKRFARNTLCALVAPRLAVTPETLVDRMLDPAVKLGMSTPKADPSGDYAFELFAKAGTLRPGAEQALAAKALKLTGGPDSPPPPPDRSVYGMLVAGGQADVFLTYCTNAIVAQREHPSLVVTAVPPALAVGADYGITVISVAPDAARRFAAFVLSPEGRRIIERHGFALP